MQHTLKETDFEDHLNSLWKHVKKTLKSGLIEQHFSRRTRDHHKIMTRCFNNIGLFWHFLPSDKLMVKSHFTLSYLQLMQNIRWSQADDDFCLRSWFVPTLWINNSELFWRIVSASEVHTNRDQRSQRAVAFSSAHSVLCLYAFSHPLCCFPVFNSDCPPPQWHEKHLTPPLMGLWCQWLTQRVFPAFKAAIWHEFNDTRSTF